MTTTMEDIDGEDIEFLVRASGLGRRMPSKAPK